MARAEAQAHRDLLGRGIDPRTARRARRPAPLSNAAVSGNKHSIEFLAHEFLERHVKPNRRRPDYVHRILARDVLPAWQGRDARTITPREIIELLDGIVARGSRVMANRVASLLTQMFKFGNPSRHRREFPCHAVVPPRREGKTSSAGSVRGGAEGLSSESR
jgi:hypothetical protein